MKRALLVFDSDFKLNGTTMFFINLYPLLSKRIQIDVLVYCKNASQYDKKLSDFVLGNGGNFKAIDCVDFKHDCILLKKFFKNNRYDVCHINTSHILRCSIVLFAAKRNRKDCIFISHSHTNGVSKNKFFNSFLKPCLQRYVFSQSDHLLACSEEAGIVKFGQRFFDKKGSVLNNAIDVKEFFSSYQTSKNNRLKLGIDELFVIGNVGRLSKEKNQTLLLDVLKILLDKKFLNGKVHLILVGDGDEKNVLVERAKDLNIFDHITFMGETTDIPYCLSLMNVFLFPSMYEGFGIAALEAQAAGLFVLASHGVSRRINICNRCYFMGEKDGPNEWASFINSNINRFNKLDCTNEIISCGFDLKENASKLLSYYGVKV